MTNRIFYLVISASYLLSGCDVVEPRQDRFEQTGKLIALSGGDAGVRSACISCHGLDGEGNGNLAPRLAGLDRGYLARQLDYFSQGQRKHDQMAWIARRLDWPARQKLSAYYESLPVPSRASSATNVGDCAIRKLYEQGDPKRGIASCASCHGTDGAGIGKGNPPLAAQPAPYLKSQLEAWASGKRYGNRTMLRISRLMTEDERTHLADYSSALPGATGYPVPLARCPQERRRDPKNDASVPQSYEAAPAERE
ncbi:hypothetical protein CHN51_18830 (plasmid) [Sphingorhabdus sp. YGSMI21]|nr:hypothetical protein CHN51_18830 [Sphingorhabdus sp. YGSMI21]